MNQDLCCENPTIILNPLTPELISKYGHYFMNGKEYRNRFPHRLLYNFPYSKFHPKQNGVTMDNISKFYVVDDSTGEFFDIYMQVPCGRCVLCKNSKVNSFVHRCKLESQMYDSLPWFITLTYNDEHCPKDGVSVRETQLFMKRFRINLQRAGVDFKLRYVFVGEYGKNTHRPHYHALIWGINSKTSQEYDLVSNIIDKSWPYGFNMHRLVDLKDDRAFFYTSKYLKKDGFVPAGCNKMFCCSSRKNGGIGAPFVDKVIPELRKKLNVNFQFLNKWTGCVEKLQFNRYILNRVFPTFSRSIPHEFRESLRDFGQYLSHALKLFPKNPLFVKYEKAFQLYLHRYSKSFYFGIPNICETARNTFMDLLTLHSNLAECFKTCSKYSALFPSFVFASELERKRHMFLSRLFLYKQPVDLVAKSARCRQMFSRAASCEIL